MHLHKNQDRKDTQSKRGCKCGRFKTNENALQQAFVFLAANQTSLQRAFILLLLSSPHFLLLLLLAEQLEHMQLHLQLNQCPAFIDSSMQTNKINKGTHTHIDIYIYKCNKKRIV